MRPYSHNRRLYSYTIDLTLIKTLSVTFEVQGKQDTTKYYLPNITITLNSTKVLGTKTIKSVKIKIKICPKSAKKISSWTHNSKQNKMKEKQ